MTRANPIWLLTAANDNAAIQPWPLLASRLPPEFFQLIDRVIKGRDAYRRSGLSTRGARALQALGYLLPTDLGPPDFGGRSRAYSLLARVRALSGCGPRTEADVTAWLCNLW